LAAIPVVAGTVMMKPAGLAPPANSSQFIISLRPEPKYTGQFTVLGQITDGIEIVKKISNVRSTDRPNYRPIKEIHTVRSSTSSVDPVENSRNLARRDNVA
jgi:cyclophilin family peptidyl-prolyl cis-trans isomerase